MSNVFDLFKKDTREAINIEITVHEDLKQEFPVEIHFVDSKDNTEIAGALFDLDRLTDISDYLNEVILDIQEIRGI